MNFLKIVLNFFSDLLSKLILADGDVDVPMDTSGTQQLVWAKGWSFDSFPAEDPCGVYLVQGHGTDMWFIFDRSSRMVVAVPDMEVDMLPLKLGDILNTYQYLQLRDSGYQMKVAAA